MKRNDYDVDEVEYTLFRRTVGEKKVWCVYFRDENGTRLNPIFVSKLKKLSYKGRDRKKPIPEDEEKGEMECHRIISKSLRNPEIYDSIFHKKEQSPNLIEMVRKIMDYDNSPYIQGRLMEGKPILRHTCDCNLNSFNRHIVPLIPPNLTLKDIDKDNGVILYELREKIVKLKISPTIKNKGLQSMRTTLKYCNQHGLINDNYKNRLETIHVENLNGTDPLSKDEVNKVISYYFTHTEKGTWERYKYLVILLSSTTGLRPCEIMGLKREDIVKIDRKNKCGVIHVKHGINCDDEYSTRKNKKDVYVSTYIELIEEILEFSNSNPTNTDWCFWDRNHMENHLTKDQFKGLPQSCLSDIGIKTNGRKISFYSLRKTAATIIGNKRSYKHSKSSSLLGHSNTSVTEEHYITNTIDSSIDNFKEIRQYIKLPS